MFECQTTTLSNGLRIVHCPASNHVSYCGFMIDCGTRHETTPEHYGMAHFVEHILFKGTTKRDSWHINNRMESVGGELNAFTTKEDTTFYSVFQSKDFDRACELLCDLICHATAPQHELEKEKEVVIEEIESYHDNPSELIYDVFENKLFAETDLGHNILGSVETVRTFNHSRCLQFIEQNYTPDRMVFFSYGPTPWGKVIRAIEKYYEPRVNTISPLFGNSSIREINPSNSRIIEETKTPSLEVPNTYHQSHVILGAPSYPIGHPHAAALHLANNLLGGPGMNSRLNLELREKRGLVYTVESSITKYTDGGYFSIYFGCDHADEELCLKLCKKQLQILREQPLTERQLAAAKKQMKGQLCIGTANLENNAISLAKNLLRLGKVESLEETCARLDAVSSNEIQEVANEIFAPQKLTTTILH